MLGRNGAVLVAVPSYQLGAAMAMGVKAPADPKGAAARSFMLLEILTASSLLKELREHLHAATGSALLLRHLACFTGRYRPGPSCPQGQPSLFSCGSRREVLSESVGHRKGRLAYVQ